MNKMKSRIINSIHIVQGPYQKRSSVEVLLTVSSPLKKSSTHSLDLNTLSQQAFSILEEGLPFSVTSSSGKICLTLPKKSIVKRASLIGWETFWNGLNSDQLSMVGEDCIELIIPSFGWWQVSTHSYQIDIQTRVLSQKEISQTVSLGNRVKNLILGKQTRVVLAAGMAHGLLLFVAANLDQITSQMQSMLSNQSAQQQQDGQAAGQVAAQVMMAGAEPESDFNGRSIFAAIHEDKEKNFKAEDLTTGMKGLSKLLSKPIQGLPQVKKVAGGPTGMVNSLKSLQAGLMSKPSNGLPGIAAVGSATGSRDVRWNSDFQTGSGGKGSLSEGQQQALSKIFSTYQDKFRACYETALLKFDEMTVTVSFEAVINSEGSVGQPTFSLSGRSTPESQEVLTRCLKNVMGQIKVDKKLNGIKIKNQFIFKS